MDLKWHRANTVSLNMPAVKLKVSGQKAIITSDNLTTLIREPEIISELTTEHWTIWGRFSVRARNFSLTLKFPTVSGTHTESYVMVFSLWIKKPGCNTTRFNLVSRLGMSGTKNLLPPYAFMVGVGTNLPWLLPSVKVSNKFSQC
jgi:hypothetical protein